MAGYLREMEDNPVQDGFPVEPGSFQGFFVMEHDLSRVGAGKKKQTLWVSKEQEMGRKTEYEQKSFCKS